MFLVFFWLSTLYDERKPLIIVDEDVKSSDVKKMSRVPNITPGAVGPAIRCPDDKGYMND